jgi:hypothetical protein
MGYLACMRQIINILNCILLAGMAEGKRLVGRPRHKWKDDIKMYVKK